MERRMPGRPPLTAAAMRRPCGLLASQGIRAELHAPDGRWDLEVNSLSNREPRWPTQSRAPSEATESVEQSPGLTARPTSGGQGRQPTLPQSTGEGHGAQPLPLQAN